MAGLVAIHVREGHPDFIDLPWHLPLAAWEGATERQVEMERGLSRLREAVALIERKTARP